MVIFIRDSLYTIQLQDMEHLIFLMVASIKEICLKANSMDRELLKHNNMNTKDHILKD